MAHELLLDRDFMHTQFSSWRLQQLATVNKYRLSTTGHASGVVSSAIDFLHTRAAVLRNHLLLSEGRLFVFTQSERNPGYYIYELLPAPASDEGLLAHQVAELSTDAGEAAAGGAVEALVDCSLAVVAEASLSPEPSGSSPAIGGGISGEAPTDNTAAAAAGDAPQQLLLSRGHGDIVLMRRRGDRDYYSNVVHPVRPRLPYAGVRPIILEAAVAHGNGDITAVVWAMRSKDPGGAARAATAACCEVFAVTLRPREEEGGEGEAEEAEEEEAGQGRRPRGSGRLHLSAIGVQLLKRTKLPPYLVRMLPSAAPANSPGPEGEGEGEGAAPVPAPASAPVVLLAFDPNTADLEEDVEDGAAAGPSAGAAAMDEGRPNTTTAAAGGAAAAAADDDGDDVDPRTLEQAAARLAHLTGEEQSGPQPTDQWADLYKESGPDGVGAMGAEPSVDLAAWQLGGVGGAGSGGGGDKALAPFWRLSCGAHRLLTADCAVQPLQRTQPLLLGVTDDVDCAVVCLDWRQGEAQQQQQQQQEQRQEEAGAEARGQDSAGGLQAMHVVSIPALAYVAAGKTYKRHLLLGSSETTTAATADTGSSALAAVLVESQRFMYLYGVTSTKQEYGKQQVVDLGLEEGETVLGARLVEVPRRLPREALASAFSGPVVVIATQRRLLSYRLRM